MDHHRRPSDRRQAVDAAARDYVVGRDRHGCWLAVETHGHGGGLFVSCENALRYAAEESRRPIAAIRISQEPLELRI